MVQDVPSIKAQKVVNSTITTTEHARMFPNADSDSRFSDGCLVKCTLLLMLLVFFQYAK